jgi:hypothetical protein
MSQMLVRVLKNRFPVHERHSELDAPEHVKHVESQLRHTGLGDVDLKYPVLHELAQVFVFA